MISKQVSRMAMVIGTSLIVHQANAFVSNHASFGLQPSVGLNREIHYNPSVSFKPSNSAISATNVDVLSVAQSDPSLVAGFVMICMATSPYALGILVPGPLFENFFIPVYKDENWEDLEKSRNAEIYWKLLYTTLGLYLTIQTFGEALATERDAIQIVKDSYIGWAFFYSLALVKIRIEAVRLDILRNSRLGIQIWHALVVIVLWLSVAGNQGLITVFDDIFDWDKLVTFIYEAFGQTPP